jgi:hypothetical protein
VRAIVASCGHFLRAVEPGHAIRRHPQFELAHMRILRGRQHAHVDGDARDDQGRRLEFLEQKFQRRAVKRGMARLENRQVALAGLQDGSDLPARVGPAFNEAATSAGKSVRQSPKLSFA